MWARNSAIVLMLLLRLAVSDKGDGRDRHNNEDEMLIGGGADINNIFIILNLIFIKYIFNGVILIFNILYYQNIILLINIINILLIKLKFKYKSNY